jgi:hypothetical protein
MARTEALKIVSLALKNDETSLMAITLNKNPILEDEREKAFFFVQSHNPSMSTLTFLIKIFFSCKEFNF